MWTDEQAASLARHFRLRPGLSLLDVGTGDGYALTTWGSFCRPRGSLTALVSDAEALTTVRNCIAAARLGKSATIVEGELDRLPFKDDSFDVVLAHDMLSGQEQPEVVLDEMVRVAKRAGCIAVFDMSSMLFGQEGWGNRATVGPQTFNHRVFVCEMVLRYMDGRLKLGAGDVKLGFKVPSWMEARGLKDVDARANESVTWTAPPYRSLPALSVLETDKREIQDRRGRAEFVKSFVEHARAGGAEERETRRLVRIIRAHDELGISALRSNTVTYTGVIPRICTWGFKP